MTPQTTGDFYNNFTLVLYDQTHSKSESIPSNKNYS